VAAVEAPSSVVVEGRRFPVLRLPGSEPGRVLLGTPAYPFNTFFLEELPGGGVRVGVETGFQVFYVDRDEAVIVLREALKTGSLLAGVKPVVSGLDNNVAFAVETAAAPGPEELGRILATLFNAYNIFVDAVGDVSEDLLGYVKKHAALSARRLVEAWLRENRDPGDIEEIVARLHGDEAARHLHEIITGLAERPAPAYTEQLFYQ